MAYKNISLVLTQEQLDAMKSDFTAFDGKISEIAVDLKVEERQKMKTMGDQSETFVEACLKYATDHPEFVLGLLDMEEFKRDWTLYKQLKDLEAYAAVPVEKLSDTAIAAGADALAWGHTFYDAVKVAAKANKPGADVIVAEL
ncbi:MAG: hypothetical protein GY940_43240, partial [bacterium]|nr:hypothetical protein [bacterium]